ncbi:MAG: helix-turn-helix transcriptional regulator [Kiritimatiellae bacterium]|nr:helix-turn-helix transcriptional regulator [Kiritimatiellia bacterium]
MKAVSGQIRARRRALGWSLGELARRADTSAPALSRYENGWERFEIATLRKLAGALGCELRIELAPTAPARAGARSQRALVRRLQRLFWDHRLSEDDLDRHPAWLTERVLEYGQLEDVRALLLLYGRRRFLDIAARATRLTPRTASFWSSLLKKEGPSCTKKFSRPTAWPY